MDLVLALDLLVQALEALLGLAVVSLLARWPINRRRAGRALLRLSRTRVSRTLVAGAVLLGLAEIIYEPSPVITVLVLLAVLTLPLARFVGVQFTTKDILKFELFVPWSSVDYFEWSGEGLLSFHLRRRYIDLSREKLVKTVTVSVAAKDREPLMELLSRTATTSLSDRAETGPGPGQPEGATGAAAGECHRVAEAAIAGRSSPYLQ